MSDFTSEKWDDFHAWWRGGGADTLARYGLSIVLWFSGGWFLSSVGLTLLRSILPPPFSDCPDLLVNLIAIIGGVEAVLHYMGWWGRRFRPRLWLWWAVALLLFGIVALALSIAGVASFKAFEQAAQLDKALHATPTPAKTARLAAIVQLEYDLFFRLYLDAFAGSACLSLIVLRPMPAGWASFRRFQLFLLALVTLAGRPTAGFVYANFDGWDPTPELSVLRFVLAPVLMPLAGTLTLLSLAIVIGLCVLIVFFAFVTLPLLIFDFIEKRANKAHIRAQKKAGLENYLRRFDMWLRHDQPPFRPDDSKGARFAEPNEIEHERRNDGFGFGHVADRTLFLETDKHVLLMASTRSGKGVTVIIPHLLRHQGSAFVLDPKGENARATGPRREVLNDTVHYLDPFGISGKPMSRFNPLASLTTENMEAGSKALGTALVLNEKRDHWTASGQQLLAAIILHVVSFPAYEPQTKDLVTVRRLLLGAVKETLEEMLVNDAAGGLIADLASSFLNTPEKEFGSIVSTAQRETEILDNPYIAACLAASGEAPEVDFGDWHRSTMSVYLCLSAPKFPVFNRWLRLVLTSALDAMTDQLDPPPIPVCFMLDELATLGHLGVIENAVGLSAGYGIQLVTVFQDIAQMKDLYRGRWASFIGNAGVRVLFNLDDYDTAKYWSDFLGGRLVGTLSEAQDIYGLTKGQTAGETMRPLLSPDEIMLRYAADRMLVLKQGQRPIEAERVPYWQDRTLDGLWRDPRQRRPESAFSAGSARFG